jgi:hypothetical protein
MMARISLGSDETPQLYKQMCISVRSFQEMEAFVNTKHDTKKKVMMTQKKASNT